MCTYIVACLQTLRNDSLIYLYLHLLSKIQMHCIPYPANPPLPPSSYMSFPFPPLILPAFTTILDYYFSSLLPTLFSLSSFSPLLLTVSFLVYLSTLCLSSSLLSTILPILLPPLHHPTYPPPSCPPFILFELNRSSNLNLTVEALIF